DAFEAVTNGMEDLSLFDALEGWESASPFSAWKALILAIRAFYQGEDEVAARYAVSVPAGSPAAALARVVLALLGRSGTLSGAGTRLADQIARPDPLTEQWIQDVTEGLETDDENLFWDAFASWLDLA